MKGVVSGIIRKTAERRGGYFFIRDEQGQDRFAHARNLDGISFEKLTEGASVTFEPITVEGRNNGLRADKVRVL